MTEEHKRNRTKQYLLLLGACPVGSAWAGELSPVPTPDALDRLWQTFPLQETDLEWHVWYLLRMGLGDFNSVLRTKLVTVFFNRFSELVVKQSNGWFNPYMTVVERYLCGAFEDADAYRSALQQVYREVADIDNPGQRHQVPACDSYLSTVGSMWASLNARRLLYLPICRSDLTDVTSLGRVQLPWLSQEDFLKLFPTCPLADREQERVLLRATALGAFDDLTEERWSMLCGRVHYEMSCTENVHASSVHWLADIGVRRDP